MAGHIAGRYVEAAVQRDRQMCEVAADAMSPLQHVPGGQVGAAGQVAILDVVVQPLADGLHARPAVLHRAEFLPREIGELVRIAIPAGQRVAERVR